MEPKDRDQKIWELMDRYENVLYDMTDEQIDQEYEERIGSL